MSVAGMAVALAALAACRPGAERTPDSPMTAIAQALIAPNVPVITEPTIEGQVVNAADVHMETAPFSDPDLSDLHLCTDWEIWTVAVPVERVWATPCIGGAEKVHTHLGDGSFQASYAGRRELFPETDYELRVRHRDNGGDPATEWSAFATRSFRTAAQRQPLPGAPTWRVLAPGYAVERFATGFQLPVNVAFVPQPVGGDDDPLFYVTELYGTIKMVTTDGKVSDYATGLLNYDPGGAFPGSGEQGLAGIVVDPSTGDLIVGLLYDAGGPHYPKVIRLRSTDGGRTASSITTVLDMPGESQGQSHFISNISLGPDGKLYVHMGDGFVASTALDLGSFRGKILRLALDGSALADNPFYDATDGISARDYVWAYGLRNPFGGTWRASDGAHYEVENGPSIDRFARVTRGASLGWAGSNDDMRTSALYNWDPAHAPVNVVFIEHAIFHGGDFPADKHDHAFVGESGPTWASGPQANGKRIVEFSFAADGSLASGPTTLVEYNGTGKSTVAGLAVGPGGLYFTDLYKEDSVDDPIARGASVYRVRYTGVGDGGTGLYATYHDERDFTGPQVSRVDDAIDFAWGGAAPAVGIDADGFSVRWTGSIEPRYSETYTFTTTSDDGVRLWIDGLLIIDQWNDHAPTEHSGTVALTAGTRHAIVMEMYENAGGAVAKLAWSSATQPREIVPRTRLFPVAPVGEGTGVRGAYHDELDLGGARVERTDSTIDFEWGEGEPVAGLGADTFSVRWTGEIVPRYSEAYTFTTTSDDGVRLWIGDQLIVDQWTDHGPTAHQGSIALVAGARYALRMEMYERGGGAVAKLAWSSVSQPGQIVPTRQLYPVVVPETGTGSTGTHHDAPR